MSIIVQEMGLANHSSGMESSDTIEMDWLQDTADLDQLDHDIDTAHNAVAGLEALTQVEGVPGPVLIVAAENMLTHMGYHGSLNLPSMESVEDTAYGMETIGTMIRKIWEAIKSAFKKVWDAITGFLKNLFGVKEKVDAKAGHFIKLAKVLEKTEVAKVRMVPEQCEVDDVRLFGGKRSGDMLDTGYVLKLSYTTMVNGQVWANLNTVYDFNKDDTSYSELLTHVRKGISGSLGLEHKVHKDLPNGNGLPRMSYMYSKSPEVGTGGFYVYWKTDSDDFPMTGFEPYMFGKRIPGTIMIDVVKADVIKGIYATLEEWLANSPSSEDTDKVLVLLQKHMTVIEKHLSDVGNDADSAKMSKAIKQMGLYGKSIMTSYANYITFAVKRYKVVVDTLSKAMYDPAKVILQQKTASAKSRKEREVLRKAMEDPNGTIVI